MLPLLFQYKLPVWFQTTFGPGSTLANQWNVLLFAFIASLVLYFPLSDPNRENRIGARISGLAVLVLGLLVGAVLLGREGKLELRTYGALIALGFLIGLLLATREARRTGEDPERLLDIGFWLLVSGLIGSRLFDIIVNIPTYWKTFQSAKHWYEAPIFRPWQGGIAFYGGLLGALIFFTVYTRRQQLNFWKYSDIIVPSLVFGHFFGRIGCLAAGCCYGKSCVLPWSIHRIHGFQHSGAGIHPTQIYEAGGLIVIFMLLLWMRSRKRYHGHVLVTYLTFYPILRFCVEFFRGDPGRGYAFKYDLIHKGWLDHLSGLPTWLSDAITKLVQSSQGVEILSSSQVVSLGLFTLGMIVHASLKRTGQVG